MKKIVTPGPWESDASEKYYTGHVIRRNGMIVCRMLGLGFDQHGDREKNADLIVAAANACQAVNPANPIAVAQSLTTWRELLDRAEVLTRTTGQYLRANGHRDAADSHDLLNEDLVAILLKLDRV